MELPGANVFAKRHEQAIDVNPMFAREFGSEGFHRFFRRGGFDIAPTIRDAMDVDVHADGWLSAGDA